eukprot:1179994-Prorocentrum_minimum.AAC.1
MRSFRASSAGVTTICSGGTAIHRLRRSAALGYLPVPANRTRKRGHILATDQSGVLGPIAREESGGAPKVGQPWRGSPAQGRGSGGRLKGSKGVCRGSKGVQRGSEGAGSGGRLTRGRSCSPPPGGPKGYRRRRVWQASHPLKDPRPTSSTGLPSTRKRLYASSSAPSDMSITDHSAASAEQAERSGERYSRGAFVDQRVDQPVGQRVGQTAGQRVGQTAGQRVDQTVDQTVGQTVGQTAGQQVDQTAGQRVGQTAGQRVDQTAGQRVGQTVDQTAGQQVGQTAGQRVGQRVGQTGVRRGFIDQV